MKLRSASGVFKFKEVAAVGAFAAAAAASTSIPAAAATTTFAVAAFAKRAGAARLTVLFSPACSATFSFCARHSAAAAAATARGSQVCAAVAGVAFAIVEHPAAASRSPGGSEPWSTFVSEAFVPAAATTTGNQ